MTLVTVAPYEREWTMTFRDTPWPDGTPCWVDLLIPDPRMAMDFYGALFSWNFTDQGDETGNYLLCSVWDRRAAGIMGAPAGQAGAGEGSAAWTTYLATSDADKTAAAITRAGGTLVAPPADVLAEGRMALAIDPSGARFGIWQAGHHIGVQVVAVPGALTWTEYRTPDTAAATAFYGDVFGFRVGDMRGQPAFTVAGETGEAGEAVAGLATLSADVPAGASAHWLPSFGVEDIDAVARRVTELGGSVVEGPSGTAVGQACLVTDNQGAAFAVLAMGGAPGR